MILTQRDIDLPQHTGEGSIIKFLERQIKTRMSDGEIPIRFGITKTGNRKYECELGILRNGEGTLSPEINSSIFDFAPRKVENTDKFNAVLLVPTGIGAAFGRTW